MKKSPKKLTLSRETLHALESAADLDLVRGGTVWTTRPTCARSCTCYSACNICEA